MGTTNLKTETGNVNPGPMLPLPPLPEIEHEYVLQYKKGNNIQSLNFKLKGDRKAAEIKGREYCQRHRLRFIWVSDMFVDLDATLETEV